jgi:hypothetical protein
MQLQLGSGAAPVTSDQAVHRYKGTSPEKKSCFTMMQLQLTMMQLQLVSGDRIAAAMLTLCEQPRGHLIKQFITTKGTSPEQTIMLHHDATAAGE